MNVRHFIKYIFLFAFSMLSVHTVGQFSINDQNEIRKKAVKQLTEYEKKINQLGKEVRSIDKTRKNIEAFLELFVHNRSQVYNDLDPTHLLSEYYEVETYGSNLALWYPGGISVKLDLDYSQVSNIIPQGDDVYSIDFIVEKQITGLYLGKTLRDNKILLLFRIGFLASGGQYRNFKIAGIRKATEKDYTDDSEKIREIKGVRLNSNDKRVIDRETKTIINDYANYLSLIGDTVENLEEKIMYKRSFRTLFFNSQSLVYNDILPDSKNRFVQVSDYINLYSEAFASDGGTVKFKMDSADLGTIIGINDTMFYRVVEIDKSFDGNYLGKQKIIYNNRIAIKIKFEYSSSVFKKFKIERIDPVDTKKPEINVPKVYTDLKQHKAGIKNRKETESVKLFNNDKLSGGSNIILNFGVLAGKGIISNGNLNDLDIKNESHEWKTTPKTFYSFYGLYTFMLTPKFGLNTGIGYSSASTLYSLNSHKNINDTVFYDRVTYTDANNNQYYKVIKAKFDSTVLINFINIPIGLTFIFGSGSNLHFFIKSGINMGLINNAKSTSNGYINYFGYYPNETIQEFKYKNWREFGAYIDSANNRQYNIGALLNSPYFSTYVFTGIEISFNKKISIALLGNFQYGLTELIKNNGDYADIFVKTETIKIQNAFGQSPDNLNTVNSRHVFSRKPTRIINYGLAIEFTIKL